MKNPFTKVKEYAILLTIVLVGCLILYSPFLFGNQLYLFYGDVNDDTFQTYVPMYQAVIGKILDMDFSVMDLTWCTGESLLGGQFVIFDPFALPIYLIGAAMGPEIVPKLLIWVQLLRILSAAAACNYFLGCFQLNSKAKIASSICYAFSSYMVGGIGQHYMFATAPVLFALMLALLEKSTRKSQYRIGFTISVAVSGLWSVYFCYMMLLTCGIYAMIRFWIRTEKVTWKSVVGWFGPLLAAVVVGLLLSAIVFLPTAYVLLFNSDRMSVHTSLSQMFSLKSLQQLKTTYLRFFSENAEGTMNNWHGYQSHFNAPHLYMSPLLIVSVPQYVFFLPKAEKKCRQLSIVILIGFVLAFFFPLVGTIYNAFAYHMSRYVFVMLPCLAYVIAKVLTEVRNQRFFSYIAAAVSVVATIIAAFLCNWDVVATTPAIQNNILFNFCTILVSLVFLRILSQPFTKLSRRVASSAAVVVYTALLLESWTGLFINRNNLEAEQMDWVYQNKGIHWIQQLHEDNAPQLYRTERVLTGWGNWPMFSSSLAFEYCPASGYNSVISRATVNFCDLFGKNIRRNATMGLETTVTYTYGDLGRPLDWCMADLLGIRYVLCNYPVEDPAWKLLYASSEYGDELLYENPRIQTMGTIYYGWYPDENVSDSAAVNQQMLPFAVSLDHPAVNVPLVDKPEIHSTSLNEKSLQVPSQSNLDNCTILSMDSFGYAEDTRTWLSFQASGPAGAILKCAVNTGFGFKEYNWSNGTYTLSQEPSTFLLALPNDIQEVGFYTDDVQSEDITVSDFTLITSVGKNYTTEGIEIYSQQQSGELYGTVQLEKDGILVLPIFIQDGWHLEIDGEEREIWLANTALIATELSAGTHTVRMWYEAPWGLAGTVLTLGGLICLAMMILRDKRKNPRNA